nr:SufD family Fe-S cluster assembly protein [Alphaproteobacteria bacterium]
TEGYQMSRAMLLSDHARANHKPELEIYADEVKCSHGSTIGAPDNDQLFYLQTRGFSRQQALKFLCRAFLSELINMVDDEKMQALFNHFAGYHGDE